MNNMKKTILQFGVIAALASAPSMYAANTQELLISDGTGDSFTINQAGAIIATSGTVTIVAGNITFDGLGQIDVISNVAGNVLLGSGASAIKITNASAFGLADSIPPQLQDEVSVDAQTNGSGTVTIEYTDTTYSHLGTALLLSGSESTANTPLSSVTFTAMGANGVALPATTALGSIGPLTGLSSNGTSIVANAFTGVSASLSSKAVVTFNGAGAFNTTFDIATAVPEPASVLLLGTILLVLTGVVRKKVARRS